MEGMLAVLLAAGKGARMGGGKASLDLGGRTALQRCLELLEEGGAGPVRVVLGAHEKEALLRAGADLRGAEVLVNDDPSRGQTSSLQLALAAGLPPDSDGFLLHTVDHPLVRPESVAALLHAHRRRPAHVAIVAPSVGGRRGHPTVYAAALVPEFLALAEGEPAHRVLRRDGRRVQHVVLDDPWLVDDLDTPDDLARARAELASGRD